MTGARGRKRSFLRRHSLSLASIGLLSVWIGLYRAYGPGTHWGSFFGNAIADWTGVVVMMLATKYLYERGSAESRRPPRGALGPVWRRLRDHSLSIFLLITGLAWIALYGDGFRVQVGTGRGQHRLGMDAGSWARPDDEAARGSHSKESTR